MPLPDGLNGSTAWNPAPANKSWNKWPCLDPEKPDTWVAPDAATLVILTVFTIKNYENEATKW